MLNWPWLRPQQVLRDDISNIIVTAGVQNEANMLDQNPDTQTVIGAGVQTITVNMLHSILIGRVLANGLLNNISIDLIQPNGALITIGPIVGPSLDSGPIVPLFVIGVRVNQAIASPGSLITELTILKVIPVQAQVTANVNVNNTPDTPLFVQDQHEVCNEEVTITVTGFVGSPLLLFDRDMTTGIATPASTPGVITVDYNASLLTARVVLAATLPVGTIITLTPISGAPKVWTLGAAVVGWDSGNFTPMMAISLVIDAPSDIAPSIVNEITIIKAGDNKSTVVNTPDTPLHTQCLQVVSLDEVNQTTTILTGDTMGGVPDLFDRDDTTEIDFDGNAGSGVDTNLKATVMLGRVVVSGGTFGIPNSVVITVYDTAGDAHVVYDGIKNNSSPHIVSGIDTGNFKDQPGVVFSGSSTSPIPTTRITITDVGGISQAWSMSELTLFKVIETKAFIYNEPSAPVFTQDEGVICSDEIWWPNVSQFGVIIPETVKYPFMKIPSGIWPMIAPTGFVVYPFNSPKLIDRVVVQGDFDDDATVQLLGLDGITPVWTGTIPMGLGGLDSGPIAPVTATSVMITAGAGGEADVYAINLYKVHGVQTEAFQAISSAIVMLDLAGSAEVLNGLPLAGNVTTPLVPTPFTIPDSIGGEGVLVTSKQVNAEIELTTATLITTITGYLDWYWSPDNLHWFYMASQVIDDVAGDDGSGNPNPSGFNAAEDHSKRNFAMPMNGTGMYIQIVFRNTDAINAFTVIMANIIQR